MTERKKYIIKAVLNFGGMLVGMCFLSSKLGVQKMGTSLSFNGFFIILGIFLIVVCFALCLANIVGLINYV